MSSVLYSRPFLRLGLALLGLAVALSMALVPAAHGQSDPIDTGLEPGWNLVPWGTNTDQARGGPVDAVWAWDAALQRFDAFRPNLPGGPPPAWSADTAVWVHNAADTAIPWTMPTVAGARAVRLVAGWNLAIWTGPDAFPVAQAVADLGGFAQAVWLWDAAEQRYSVFRPHSDALPSSLASLNRYDAVWLQLSAAAIWQQPAADASGDAAPLAIAVNVALDHVYIGGPDGVGDTLTLEIRAAAGAILFSAEIAASELEQVSVSTPLSTVGFPLGSLVPPETHGVDIAPGMSVQASSGGRSGTVVVDSITVQEFDPASDGVLITGPPGGVFDLWVLRESEGSVVTGYVLGAAGRAVLSRSAIAAIVGAEVLWVGANSPSSALGDPFSTVAFAQGASVGPE